jgi:NAD+ diphosphatase
MWRSNFYSGAGLDRADHLRLDEAWLEARLGDRSTRLVAVWRSKNLVMASREPRAVWLEGTQAVDLVARAGTLAFLGLNETRAYFALDVSSVEAPERELGLAEIGDFRDLRTVGPLMERWEGAVLAYARGLMHWHRRHRCCGACGWPTENRRGGHLRVCTSPACGLQHFPRTDPAVIMLVHDGERCVLGRQKVWPPGMHSTLAGFVEPGESLEEAVAREVAEEVGLRLDLRRIAYQSSQPWPFPSSLMLGFHARVAPAEIRVNPQELESAAWYSRADLLNSPEDEHFRLPRADSIARRLIEDWLAEDL